eukprot:GILK01005036.1.p1 GENE.GILK01005036.1~~GILK01005036.1.p1  ORF type:complete len:1072 (+),score=61.20 GILK01005036.1:64-3216(+)
MSNLHLCVVITLCISGLRSAWTVCYYEQLHSSVGSKTVLASAQAFGYLVGQVFVQCSCWSRKKQDRPTRHYALAVVLICLTSWFLFGFVSGPLRNLVIGCGASSLPFLVSLLANKHVSGELVSFLVLVSHCACPGTAKILGSLLSSIVADEWVGFVSAIILSFPLLYIFRLLDSAPYHTIGQPLAKNREEQIRLLVENLALVVPFCCIVVSLSSFSAIRDTFQTEAWMNGAGNKPSPLDLLMIEVGSVCIYTILRKYLFPAFESSNELKRSRAFLSLFLSVFVLAVSSLAPLSALFSLYAWYIATGVACYLLSHLVVYVSYPFVAARVATNASVSVVTLHGLQQIFSAFGSAFALLIKALGPDSLSTSFVLQYSALVCAVGSLASLPLLYQTVRNPSTMRLILLTIVLVMFGLFTHMKFSFANPLSRRVFIDLDNTLVDAQPRFHRYSIPSWPGTGLSSQALAADSYSRDLPFKGAIEALNILRDRGFHITILSARASYERANEVSERWLKTHRVPFDSLIITQTSDDKKIVVRSCAREHALCVLIDDLTTGHEFKYTTLHTKVLCDPLFADSNSVARLELFDPHYNNWQNVIHHLVPEVTSLPDQLVPSLLIVKTACSGQWAYDIWSKYLVASGVRETANHTEYDVAWVIAQCWLRDMDCVEEARKGLQFVDSSYAQMTPDGWHLPRQHQRLNSVRGIMDFMSSKRNLCRLLQTHNMTDGSPYGDCFILPEQWDALLSVVQLNSSYTWIYKPSTSANGVGTQILGGNELKAMIDPKLGAMVQRYIVDPLLYRGFKIDVRVYGLITSFDPLRLYIYRRAYARVGGSPYNMTDFNPAAHVTNSDANKQYVRLTYSQVEDHMSHVYRLDPALVWLRIRRMMSHSVVAMAKELGCTSANYSSSCGTYFQHFCVDLVIDTSGQVWLLEFNADPSVKFRNEDIWKDDVQRMADTLQLLGVRKRHDVWFSNRYSVVSGLCQAAQHANAVPTELARMMMEYQLRGEFDLVFPSVYVDEWERDADSHIVRSYLAMEAPTRYLMYQNFLRWARSARAEL